MGADIHHLTPCCKTEDYKVEGEKGEKCKRCDGRGTEWFMLSSQEGAEPSKDICSICDGEGVLKEDIYRCKTCGTVFNKLIEDTVDYGDE